MSCWRSVCRQTALERLFVWFVLLSTTCTTGVGASPNLPLDGSVSEELERLEALGRLSPYTGGFRPLTEARARYLLFVAGEPTDSFDTRGWWWKPLRRLQVRGALVHEDDRPYSTIARPRDIAGIVAVSCEDREGHPCGDGSGLITEFDSAAGYGPWVSGFMRFRMREGTGGYKDRGDLWGDLDRAYINGELGHVAVEVGRDVLVLGPSVRTQLAWGDHAPPLDQIRLATSEPFALTHALHASVVYLLGRLRAPQAYPGNLVSVARGQFDFGASIEVGVEQLLQVEGTGAPHLGPLDFFLEHFRRGDSSAGPADSSNRRFGGDVSARIAELDGARLYYELVFEDIRLKRVIDAYRYDADHLVGIELAAIGPGRRHGLVIEWHKTGVRSEEHTVRTTGFTNAGRVVGSPLGPDAQSIYAGGRIALGWATLSPWAEIARLSSDTYTFVEHGPISRVTEGVAEVRYRAGSRVRLRVSPELRFEAEAMFEHVVHAGFDPPASRENLGVIASVIWEPTRLRFATR